AEPAHKIVISDLADRAILAARRGEVVRLSRLDIAGKRVQTWCEARVSTFALDFDGLTWFVAREGTLYAIDAIGARWEHLWKVDEERALAIAIRRNAAAMSVWFNLRVQPMRNEVWTYELPSLTLRRRQEISEAEVKGSYIYA